MGDPHLALYLRQCPGQAGTLGRIRLAGIPCNLCQSQHGLTACWATPSARCQRHSVRQQLTKPLLLPVTQHSCDSAIAGCPAATPGAGPILTPISALPPSSCQHHQKEHLTENKPFFLPLVLAARLSPARGRRSCQRLNLTHPFNLGGRNTFVLDNVHQMVAPGAPVAAAPDGWATGASPDLCLYVICIAAGGFSSHRQLRQHQPGRSDSPGMAVGTALEGPGPMAVLASWHLRQRATVPEDTCQAVPAPDAWLRWGWRDGESRAGACHAEGTKDTLTAGSATRPAEGRGQAAALVLWVTFCHQGVL